MKWPKTPADLLSEKTFLVLREDLKTIGEKGQGGAEPTVTAEEETATSTWPKMRKKRGKKGADERSDGEEPRPATASLEAPLVLDPRLVDKLDMSLLSKESFNASITRINLGLVKSVTIVDNPASTVSTKNNNASPQTQTIVKPRPRLALRSGRKGSVDSSESATTTSTSSSSAEGASSPEGSKRLDDNNNKNKTNTSQQQQLSPLRSRSSRSTVSSSDVALFTSNPSAIAKKKPEPCKTCGRAAQPERFHSHPKSPTSSPVKEKELQQPLSSARSTTSVIPVRGNRISSQRRTSARQEQQQHIPGGVPDRRRSNSPTMANVQSPGSAASSMKHEKVLIEEDIKKERNEDSFSSTDDKSAMSILKRRPRTVTCYICGREFGTASFPIHEPKCLERWNRENKALPSSQRREPPQRPNVPIDHEDWNAAAWEQSQALLIPCPKCKRTFLPDRLAIHERNCRAPNKANTTNNNNNNNTARIIAKSSTDPQTVSAVVEETSAANTPRKLVASRRTSKDNPDASAKRQSRPIQREKNTFA